MKYMLPEKCTRCKIGFAKISCSICHKKYCELCSHMINGICEICRQRDPVKRVTRKNGNIFPIDPFKR